MIPLSFLLLKISRGRPPQAGGGSAPFHKQPKGCTAGVQVVHAKHPPNFRKDPSYGLL